MVSVVGGCFRPAALQIFYRNSQQSDFEAAREEALKGVVTRMQRQARKFIVRCRYARWVRVLNVVKEAMASRLLEKLDVRVVASLWGYPLRSLTCCAVSVAPQQVLAGCVVTFHALFCRC